MTVRPARWVVSDTPDPAAVERLCASLNVPQTLAALLTQRGYGDPEEARQFLRPRLESLSDPLMLRDMPRAVELVAQAVRRGARILIHGDYDVDGQCATVLLTRVLRAAGGDAVPFVPHRQRDGYDFGPAGLQQAREVGASLVITCDCGTTAVDAVAAARAAGIAVVVTDHHLPGPTTPADAMVNPQHPDCPSAVRELCGAGVAFKLAQAVARELGLPESLPYHFLDLVALATVADVVPLVRENRVLVRHGLRVLSASRWPGIRALVEVAGLSGKEIRAGQVGYILGPRLNAAGRIGEPMDGVRLLLSDDETQARDLARHLETLNARRQAIDEETLEEAVREVEETVDLAETYGLVLASEGWHAGVIGLIASRLVERYARPAILIALEGSEGKGSGRSIPQLDLHGALTECAPLLSRYGGHRMAAGLTIAREQVAAFRSRFDAAVRARLSQEDLVPTQRIDVLVPIAQLTDELERLFQHLEPCGMGNPSPVLGISGGAIRNQKTVGTNHVRFTLADGTGSIGAIAFNWADRLPGEWQRRPVDVAVRLERNEWRGESALQARVVQIRPAA